MLISILIGGALAVCVGYLYRRIRALELKAQIANRNPDDAAALALDKHVQEYHQ